jgi:hypothetical protein
MEPIAKAHNNEVINGINLLKRHFRFIVKKNKNGTPHKLKYIEIDEKGHLTYIDSNNERVSVSTLTNSIAGYGTRWLNHLYFIDKSNKIIKFKKHIAETHNLNFT